MHHPILAQKTSINRVTDFLSDRLLGAFLPSDVDGLPSNLLIWPRSKARLQHKELTIMGRVILFQVSGCF